jgi:hypothetical protein
LLLQPKSLVFFIFGKISGNPDAKHGLYHLLKQGLKGNKKPGKTKLNQSKNTNYHE